MTGPQLLKNSGLKVTDQRLRILDILSESKYPITAYSLQEKLSDLNISTIYRVLDKLVSAKIIHRIENLNSYILCSGSTNKNCHHFMICKDCSDTKEFESEDLCEIEESISKKNSFKPMNHSIEIVGLCSKCS